MRIAQVTITKTRSGYWKIVTQSLTQTETADSYKKLDDLLNRLNDLAQGHDWEQLSLDFT